MNRREQLITTIAQLLSVDAKIGAAAVTVRIDDSSGWHRIGAGTNERDASEIQQQYTDALTAWRKNPMAKRIVDITTDYCLGDGLTPTATGQLGNWLDRWWTHPKNNLSIRLPELSDELCRSGDLFLSLHRNPDDGISYVRPIPKDQITRIETLPNDWETEIAFYQSVTGIEDKRWLSPAHPDATNADAVMVHYAVNRVVGALLGDSDLATMLPWLLRYSRLLEDRVRLHWAAKMFLWIITVPTNLVTAKREQYNTPPETGSVIIKDEQEKWEPVTPNLHAFDAQYDLRSVRQMIDAGSGFPPHWRGEPTDINLATATAMERAASRRLRRRQLYIKFIVRDLAHTAYSRSFEIGHGRNIPSLAAINVDTPDVSRQDNETLATAAKSIASALTELQGSLPGPSRTLTQKILRLVLQFAGETLTEDETNTIMEEAYDESD